jgi:cytochrome c biogenesis protein CcdA
VTPDAVFAPFYSQATEWINLAAQGVDTLPVSYAFAAGMLATLNPCGFVMLPAFAAFYLTAAGAEPQASAWLRLVRAVRMGLLVSIAFVVIFAAVGLVVTAGGRVVMQWAGWAGVTVGVALAAFGLYQLVTRRSIFASMTSTVRVRRAGTTRGVVLFGVGYAVCSLGCTLPVFLVVVGSVFVGNSDYADSVRRFVEYGAGMGVVLTAVTVAVAFARERGTRSVRRVLPYVDVAANIALMFAGSYIVWYWTGQGGVL